MSARTRSAVNGAGMNTRRARRGMSLVEVVVAMSLLVGVILVLGAFSAKFSQSANQAHLVITADEIAVARLDAIRQQPTYAAIDTLVTSSAQPWRDSVKYDNTWFRRLTQVTRYGGAVTDSVDYKMVTVSVSHPSMRKIVTKTTAVAAF